MGCNCGKNRTKLAYFVDHEDGTSEEFDRIWDARQRRKELGGTATVRSVSLPVVTQ